MRHTGWVVGLTAIALGGAPSALGADDSIALTANGNAVTGGLAFAPATVTAHVGQSLRWTDTDVIAPHTVTEQHGLFDLVGNNVNGTPISASGFGPRTGVELTAAAGTINYYCRVHPGQMNGTIRVPVTLALGPGPAPSQAAARTAAGARRRAARRRAFQRTLTLTWAASAPAAGEAFDVETRRGGGAWVRLRTATTTTAATIRAGRRGTQTAVRARLRRSDDASRATGWSPEATVTG